MDIHLSHHPEQRRFVADVDGHQGHVEYVLHDGVMAIIHTIVPPDIGGRGVAAALMQAAVEHARANGLKIAPRCAYAETWMRRHPEYEALRA